MPGRSPCGWRPCRRSSFRLPTGRTPLPSRCSSGSKPPGSRAELDARSEKVNFKIREAQLQKIPYMLVVGERETEAGTVAVRHRKRGNEGAAGVNEFIARVRELIDSKDTKD